MEAIPEVHPHQSTINDQLRPSVHSAPKNCALMGAGLPLLTLPLISEIPRRQRPVSQGQIKVANENQVVLCHIP